MSQLALGRGGAAMEAAGGARRGRLSGIVVQSVESWPVWNRGQISVEVWTSREDRWEGSGVIPTARASGLVGKRSTKCQRNGQPRVEEAEDEEEGSEDLGL